jgi:hypothetical protein
MVDAEAQHAALRPFPLIQLVLGQGVRFFSRLNPQYVVSFPGRNYGWYSRGDSVRFGGRIEHETQS